MDFYRDLRIGRYFRWTFYSLVCGILAGAAATVFLITLNGVTAIRMATPLLLWALPAAGLAIGWMYHHHGQSVSRGHNLILDEIRDPRKTVPLRMAPFIFVGTILTHLFGGSAGREGTVVQMGASLSDQLSRFWKIEPEERKILLVAGAGAGFGSAMGVPLAGMIFGMEVIQIGRLRLFAWLECLIASYAGFYTAQFLGAPHTLYAPIEVAGFPIPTLLLVALAGLLFGAVARLFIWTTHLIETIQDKYVTYPPLKPFYGGLVLVSLYLLLDTARYAGLGIPVIQQALVSPTPLMDPLAKLGFTALTIGSGFKGGEFVPLVFIGTTLGNILSPLLHVPLPILAAAGFAAVFAGASNTPLACTIMAVELFGWGMAPYAAFACYTSYFVSGHHSLYKSQKIARRKRDQLKDYVRLLKISIRLTSGSK